MKHEIQTTNSQGILEILSFYEITRASNQGNQALESVYNCYT